MLTSSRKKYVRRDEGLEGLAGEKSILAADISYVSFSALAKSISSEVAIPTIIN